jgi:hypothetical protein
MATEALPARETTTPQATIDKKPPTLDTSIETLGIKESTALSPHVINVAMRALIDYLKQKWIQVTNVAFRDVPEAQRFNAMRNQYKIDLENNPEVKQLFDQIASMDVKEVNEFLKKKGFNIELKRDENGSIYFAGTFEQKWDWQKWGTPLLDGNVAFMESREDLIKSINIPKWMIQVFSHKGENVYEITTANGDKMYIMKAWGVQRISKYWLDGEIRQIDKEIISKGGSPAQKWLVLPQIRYDKSEKLDWLIGTGIDVKWEEWYRISQAQMQTKLNITPTWFEASAGAAGAARPRSLSMNDTIDSPFALWIKKGNVITFVGRMWRESMISDK